MGWSHKAGSSHAAAPPTGSTWWGGFTTSSLSPGLQQADLKTKEEILNMKSADILCGSLILGLLVSLRFVIWKQQDAADLHGKPTVCPILR